ncbi:hypothetical protein QFC19_008460 [Naganishia cerealis]|uniref:Uncharacterized protein n=1 Tax=Naganishia cerealis TaxID=610337 RepID=A0ACC2V291_9TREE|nr:hypothetical protein QFC19_008460 [Naganishia cerealis]
MSISPLAEIIDFFGQLSLYATVCIIVAWGPVSLYLAGGLILRLFGTSENSRVIQKGPVVVQKEPRVVRKELRVAHSGPSQEVSLGPDNVEVQATPTKETKRPRGGRNHAAGLAAYQAEIMNWHDLQIPKGYSLNVTACHIGTSATDGHAKKKKDHEDMPLRKTSREFAERVSRDMRDWSVNRR